MADGRTLKEKILTLLKDNPGLSDREITDRLLGKDVGQQAINQACHSLEKEGRLERKTRPDGKIGNYATSSNPNSHAVETPQTKQTDALSEDSIKTKLQLWLEGQGWETNIKWGHDRGIDVDARRPNERWIIEVKGRGAYQQMNVNYFLTVLGGTLQKMEDAQARYSIALPDLPQFRGLWGRLPELAKGRTTITALFIDPDGNIDEQP